MTPATRLHTVSPDRQPHLRAAARCRARREPAARRRGPRPRRHASTAPTSCASSSSARTSAKAARDVARRRLIRRPGATAPRSRHQKLEARTGKWEVGNRSHVSLPAPSFQPPTSNLQPYPHGVLIARAPGTPPAAARAARPRPPTGCPASPSPFTCTATPFASMLSTRTYAAPPRSSAVLRILRERPPDFVDDPAHLREIARHVHRHRDAHAREVARAGSP